MKANGQIKYIVFLLFFNNIYSQNYYMDLHKEISKNNYLSYINIIEKNIKDRDNYAMLSAGYSYVGNYKKSLEFYFANEHMKNFILDENSSYNNKKIDYSIISNTLLLSTTKEYDFILFNEAHHKPVNRIYIKNNLKKLYDNGYKYFFIEALYDKEINTRNYPLIKSLTYKDPSFGLLVREALQVGFKLFGYVKPKKRRVSIQEREDDMYLQITQIIDSLPKAKSLVLGGYSHISNRINKTNNVRSLGSLLSTRFKVFSIDQTTFTEEYSKDLEKTFYKNISKKIKKATVLKINSDFLYDYTVVQPRTKYNKNNIPNWYFENNKSHCFMTKKIKSLLNINKKYLLQIFFENEYKLNNDKCLPVFQLIFTIDDKKLAIPLFKKKVIIICRDETGEIIYTE